MNQKLLLDGVAGFNLKGTDGVDGSKGAIRKDGVNGKDDSPILNGYGYPLAEIGQIWGFYIDLNDFALYRPMITDTDWGMTGIILRGTNGTDGKDGLEGKDANVRTYILTNFWNYYYSEVLTMGIFRFTKQWAFDNFVHEADYGIVLRLMEYAWTENNTSRLMGAQPCAHLLQSLSRQVRLLKTKGW